MKNKSLVVRLTARIVLITALLMAAIAVVVSVSLTDMITRMSEQRIEELAEQNAQLTSEYLNTLGEKATALSNVISTYQGMNEEVTKNLVRQYFTSAMQDKRVFGIYLAFEPNTFYRDTPDGYSFYAYQSGNGLVFENYTYDDYKDIEAYAVPKQTHSAHITEPYSWTLTNGQVIWLITYAVPLYDARGSFIGVASCDVSTDTINALDLQMGGYETSYSYIITNDGNYVVHSLDDSKSGTAYAEAGETEAVLAAAANGERKIFEDENQVFGGRAYKIQVPLSVNGVNEVWSSAFVVSRSEVLRGVIDLLIVITVSAGAGLLLMIFITALFLRRSLNPVKELVRVAGDMENGRLSSTAEVKTGDELGRLSQSFNRMAQTLNGYISEISALLRAISRGDLTAAAERDYAGDFLPIKDSLAGILIALNEAFGDIHAIAEQVSAGSSQLASGAQTLASGATEQAAALEELVASISHIAEDVQKNSGHVAEASAYIQEAGAGVRQSNESMQELMKAMEGINEASVRISGIIKMIDDISFQTNILALNAAVEAAHAGAAGKGFAVVAEEVRTLASRSADAARQTSELIGSSVAAIENGTKLAQNTATDLAVVEQKTILVERTNELIREASDAQAMAVQEMRQGLAQVSQVTQTITATAEENAAASEELSAQARKLFEHASHFKTIRTGGKLAGQARAEEENGL